MPKFKGLQVNVCIDGEPVEEFGTSTHSRSNTITTWIESKSDQAFTIRFEHDVPWDFSEGGTLKVVNGRVQKYDLRVDVYFDGNADRETGIILTDIGSIVDSADCRRRAIFENAVVEQQDGAVVYQTWIFRDAGVIDRMIGKLCLGPTKSGSEPDDQLELANTLQPTQIDNSTTKPHSKLGKITLIVRRRLVTRKRVYTDPSMLADRYQDDKRETEIDADDDDITHRVAGLSGDAVTAEPFTLYDSRPFDRGLGHYAKFDIYYRDRRRLAKLDLLSGSQLNNTKRKTTLKLLMPQKPSLNLLNEQRRLGKRKSRNSPEAFEEKIKKGSLRLHQDDTLEGFSHDGPRSTDKQSNDHSDDDSEDAKDCVSNNGSRKMRKLTRRPYARDQASIPKNCMPKNGIAASGDKPTSTTLRRSARIQKLEQYKAESTSSSLTRDQRFRDPNNVETASNHESEAETESESNQDSEESDREEYRSNPDEDQPHHRATRKKMDEMVIKK